MRNNERSFFQRAVTTCALLSGLLVFLFAGSVAFAQQATTVNYVYDENGRLRIVTFPTGEASVYEYDAAGNLISVRQEQGSVISILYFTPRTGAVNTTVNLYGTGFSTTPTQNTVLFNGTAATVLSSSVSQVTVKVPAGASTGKIQVTSPIGTALSVDVFTVAEAPQITSLIPFIGKRRDPVSVLGTNFLPTNGSLLFNQTSASIDSVVSDRIETSVPDLATSGRLTYTSEAGTVVSDQDFFVVPDGFQVSDVSDTGRLTLGNERIANLGSQGRLAMLVFDGTAGQRVSINAIMVNSQPFFSFSCDISVRNPNGSVLIPPVSTFSNDGFVEPFTLPVTGTYTVLLDKGGSFNSFNSGIAKVTLYDVLPDATGSIQIDGPSVTVGNAEPGQNIRLSFDGAAGQTINASGFVLPPYIGSSSISILTSDGGVVFGPSTMLQSPSGLPLTAFGERIVLPVSGSYTLLIDHARGGIFPVTVRLNTPPPDVVVPIEANGNPVTASTTESGQNIRLTFDGNANQRISLKIASFSFNNGGQMTILQPNGFVLTNGFISGPRFFDTMVLPETGSYSIVLDPAGSWTGSATVSLYTVPPDAVGDLILDGPPVTVSAGTPGQNIEFTFDGTDNQIVNLNFTNLSIGLSQVTVNRPDGSAMNFFVMPASGRFLENLVLPTAGTYSVEIDLLGEATGSVTGTLSSPPTDIIGTIVVGGPTVSLDFANPGQRARLSFSGQATKSYVLQFSNVSVGTSKISVLKPNGTVFIQNIAVTSSGGTVLLDTLPVDGSYTIVIDPDAAQIGLMTVALSELQDVEQDLQYNGSPVTAATTLSGQKIRFHFNAAQGQRAFVRLTNPQFFGSATLLAPDGTTIVSGMPVSFGVPASIDVHNLPSNGSYTIVAQPNSGSFGAVTASVGDTASSAIGEIVQIQFLDPGQTAVLNVSGHVGDRVDFRKFSPATISQGTLSVYRPDGTVLVSIPLSASRTGRLTLPVTGVYRVEVTPAAGVTGSYTLNIAFANGGS